MSFTQIVLIYLFMMTVAGLFSFMFVMIWRSVWKDERNDPRR